MRRFSNCERESAKRFLDTSGTLFLLIIPTEYSELLSAQYLFGPVLSGLFKALLLTMEYLNDILVLFKFQEWIIYS